jgi:hypothetical protein
LLHDQDTTGVVDARDDRTDPWPLPLGAVDHAR